MIRYILWAKIERGERVRCELKNVGFGTNEG